MAKQCKCLVKAIKVVRKHYGDGAELDLPLSFDGAKWSTRPYAIKFTYRDKPRGPKRTGYVAATHCSMCGAPYPRTVKRPAKPTRKAAAK